MQESLFPTGPDHIYTVTEITREIKSILEDQFADIWLTGEISNFHAHSSGHFYFTLKDENSQITAVMFKGANRHLKFQPEDGLEVLANGRVTIYEPRGNYQIIVEQLEPKGLGALQLAFEQLRKKLEAEGLFDEERKKSLPFLPKRIGIVTSPTGAVIRDMIHVIHRRNRRTDILISPVNVQGEEAAPSIAEGISRMNCYGNIDLIIVGRGGGSLEDLWAFNTELVARAIASSEIPIISAVGHETDFTIADFVADLRAPTPSAAAEIAVPQLSDLENILKERIVQLGRRTRNILGEKRHQLKFFISHLKHPKKRLEEMTQRLDDLISSLREAIQQSLIEHRTHLSHLSEKLEVLSPLSILSRGFSIVHKVGPEGKLGPILKEAGKAKSGELLSIQLMKGVLQAVVK